MRLTLMFTESAAAGFCPTAFILSPRLVFSRIHQQTGTSMKAPAHQQAVIEENLPDEGNITQQRYFTGVNPDTVLICTDSDLEQQA